jgi:hypothetical protein
MLAFDDAALARLAIAATAVPPAKRAAWLKKFAERADPPAGQPTNRQRAEGTVTLSGHVGCLSSCPREKVPPKAGL